MNDDAAKLPTIQPPARSGLSGIFGGLAKRVFGDRTCRQDLRSRLLIGALLLGTLPLLLTTIILPMRVRSTLTANGQDHLNQVARDLAALTQNELQGHKYTLSSLSRVESLVTALRRNNTGVLEPMELAAANRQIAACVAGLGDEFQGLFLAGTNGRIFAGVLRSGETEPYVNLDIRDRAYFNQVRATLQPVISDTLVSKVSGVPVIVIAVPITDDQGAFAGMMGLSIEIRHLTSVITAQKIGQTGYPFAIDRHGVIMAHPDPKRAFRELGSIPGAERLAARMLKGETGIENYTSSIGTAKVAAFAPVPIAGWSIAASIDASEFAAAAQRVRWIIFAMIGAGILIALAMTSAFSVGFRALKKALDETRASETRFRLFAGVSGEIIWDWDLASDVIWWNKGRVTAQGFLPGEVAGAEKVFAEWLPADEREKIIQGIRSCIAGDSWSGEHHFRRPDGSMAYVLHRAAAVRDAEGRTLRVLGSMTDITQRRATEKKLAEQAALLDQTRDGIMVRDLNQVIQFWNRGSELLYGWTAAEAIGRELDELLQINSSQFTEAVLHVMKRGAWSGQLNKTNKAGQVLVVDCRWTLLRDEKGLPRSILAVDSDVTERKQMEAKFLRAQRMESIGTLAGGIAHDFNNLLGPVIMGVGLLNEAKLSEENQSIVQVIGQSASRGTSLVKQLLSFARGIEGARVSVHIGYVAREVEAIIRSTFPKNINLRLEIAKEVRLVNADPTQINQVLLNLCVNARDAMPLGGHLTISAKNVELDENFARINRDITPGPHVLIEVADTGTGIPPDVLEKIFEPFFTTKEAGKGTGLGLSTVMGISRSHGGTVGVYSEQGKGTVFKVYLPAIVDTSARASEPVVVGSLPRGQGELVLLVDDEPSIRKFTKRALELFGYKVLVAADGAQAFALYHQHRTQIAVVLTDMMMPVMDGAALIAAMRRIDPEVIVVAASGLNDNNNQIKADAADIRHFLCKPYTTASMLTVLRDALHPKYQATPRPTGNPPPAALAQPRT